MTKFSRNGSDIIRSFALSYIFFKKKFAKLVNLSCCLRFHCLCRTLLKLVQSSGSKMKAYFHDLSTCQQKLFMTKKFNDNAGTKTWINKHKHRQLEINQNEIE